MDLSSVHTSFITGQIDGFNKLYFYPKQTLKRLKIQQGVCKCVNWGSLCLNLNILWAFTLIIYGVFWEVNVHLNETEYFFCLNGEHSSLDGKIVHVQINPTFYKYQYVSSTLYLDNKHSFVHIYTVMFV